MNARRHLLLLLASSMLARAQLEFEVVTIKASPSQPSPEAIAAMKIQRGPLYFDFPRTTLFDMLYMGFGVDPTQVEAPEWTKTVYFDISAKASRDVTQAEARTMLAFVLRDRFQLVFHRESRSAPVYTLMVAKGGVRMVDASLGNPEDPHGSPLPEQKEGGPLWLLPGKSATKRYTRSEDGVTLAAGRATRLADVTFILDRSLRSFDRRRTLLDETGLTGSYDFGIQFLDPSTEVRQRDAAASGVLGIFTAVEEYLGLKIQEATRPIEVIVVESLNRTPTDN